MHFEAMFPSRLWQTTGPVVAPVGDDSTVITFLQQLINGISQGSAYALIALGYTMVYGVLRPHQLRAQRRLHVRRVHGVLHRQQPTGSGAAWARPLLAAIVVMLLAMALSAGSRDAHRALRLPAGPHADSFTLAFWLGILGAVFGDLLADLGVGVLAGAAIGIAVGVVVELLDSARPAGFAAGSADHRHRRLAVSGERRPAGLRRRSEVLSRDHSFHVAQCRRAEPRYAEAHRSGRFDHAHGAAESLVNYTKTGKAMRAVSFNLDAAKLMGINTDRIIAFTFALGSALAAAGGILVSLLYPKIDPLMGVMPGLKAFVAAVLGGIGNITGAMVGGLILGFAEVMAVGYGHRLIGTPSRSSFSS